MSLTTYEEVRPYARAIKQRTGLGPRAGRDAAVVRREEHRHPALQGRPVAERRGDRHHREVGRQRRAARQPRRHAAAHARTRWARTDGCSASPISSSRGRRSSCPRWRRTSGATIGSVPTGLTEDRWVKSVEVREINDIPRAEGTKTVGGRYVFHHMNYQSSVPGAGEHELADSRDWPQPGRVPRYRRPAARRQLDPRAERVARPRERSRHALAPRVRLPVLPERLPADLPARRP